MKELIRAVILSLLPISELRGGLPLAVHYATRNHVSILPIFIIIVAANILVIFLLFLFLDFLHDSFMRIPLYARTFDFFLRTIRKKAAQVERGMAKYGYVALCLFVAVPLPATGAWTGTFIAWFLGLERKRSIAAISIGVLIAGVIVLLASLGIITLFKIA